MTTTQPTDRDQLADALRGKAYPVDIPGAVDALLPVVDAIARHRAATELRRQAEILRGVYRDLGPRADLPTLADKIDAAADALERQDPQ